MLLLMYELERNSIMAAKNDSFTRITDEILKFTDLAERNTQIDTSLYAKYDVKRGLRDINGNGVLTGLTNISDFGRFAYLRVCGIDRRFANCHGQSVLHLDQTYQSVFGTGTKKSDHYGPDKKVDAAFGHWCAYRCG